MANKIAILGSTGSIGIQSLEVAKNLGKEIIGISGNTNVKLLIKQAKEFLPKIVAIRDESYYVELKKELKDLPIEVVGGDSGIIEVATLSEIDTLVSSIVGIAGFIPTIEAIKNKKNIALANKEALVVAGEIIMKEAKKSGINIYPIDSEHSAISQCLMGNNVKNVQKIVLTASGGPFRGKSIEQLKKVTLNEALKHPNWNMGSKITIDCATLMNKGLEVIEAKWLFDLQINQIEVIIHPESIIHSMVYYVDNSVISQMGTPDMRIPIQFALTYPNRVLNNFSKLDLIKNASLTFEKPDNNTFPCLNLAFEALKIGGTMPVVLNSANEVLVNLFLKQKISFMDIPYYIENMLEGHTPNKSPSYLDIIEVDKETREKVLKKIKVL